MSDNAVAIIAIGITWPNTSLDYEVQKEGGGVELISFEIGESGFPEATTLPTTAKGYEYFLASPKMFAIVNEGDDFKLQGHYNIDAECRAYLNSMTARAVPFLQRCLDENSVGRNRYEVEQRLTVLKLREAKRVEDQAEADEILARSEKRKKAAAKPKPEPESEPNESAEEAPEEAQEETPPPPKKAAKKKAAKKTSKKKAS